MPPPKLDGRVRLSGQFRQFVTVFVVERERIWSGAGVVHERGESGESGEETAVDAGKFQVFYSLLSL
jgi:hypothetical protein